MENKKLTIFTIFFIILAVVLGNMSRLHDEQVKEIRELKLDVASAPVKLEKKVSINLYVPNEKLDNLEKQTMEVIYTENRGEIVDLVVKSLSHQMKKNNLLKDDLIVLNSFFRGKDLYLDLKDDEDLHENDNKTLYILYSISNTLISLGGIERIKFLLDGQESKGLFDQYYDKNIVL